MNIVKATPAETIQLGRQGEKGVTRVEFDLLLFVQQYGSGTAKLMVRRAGESEVYPAIITQAGNTATWDIGAEWTATAGIGRCELHWYVGDQLAKSEVYRTEVIAALQDPEAEPPKAGQAWMDQVEAELAETKAIAQSSLPKWELLKDWTAASTVYSVLLPVEANAVTILVELPSAASAATLNFTLHGTTDNGSFENTASAATPTDGAPRYWNMWSDTDSGVVKKVYTSGRVSSAPEVAWSNPYTQIVTLGNFEQFTEFRIRGTIPKGLRVRIYGVRRATA